MSCAPPKTLQLRKDVLLYIFHESTNISITWQNAAKAKVQSFCCSAMNCSTFQVTKSLEAFLGFSIFQQMDQCEWISFKFSYLYHTHTHTYIYIYICIYDIYICVCVCVCVLLMQWSSSSQVRRRKNCSCISFDRFIRIYNINITIAYFRSIDCECLPCMYVRWVN